MMRAFEMRDRTPAALASDSNNTGGLVAPAASRTVADNGGFDMTAAQGPITVTTSTVVAPGASETLEFQAPDPGEYAFVCTLHPGMGGTLVVEAR